jgi:hypothetical protein
MNIGIKIALVTLVTVFALVAMLAGSYISAHNKGIRLETSIGAAWKDNQNVLSSYTLKVQEAAQIPAMQRDDLAAVVTAALDARYGANGSQAMMQWIQEQNPTIDSSVYTQLQRTIEAGRDDFKNAQTRLIDQKRVYETALGSFWTGAWMRIAGFPRVDLEKFNIVLDNSTNAAFEAGTSQIIELR